MVKLARRGAQDPSDPSLQMKVTYPLISGQTIPRHGKKTPYRARSQPKSLCFETFR